ncbi:MAG: cbb3-type cytochrome c oxidase subunit 3 [Gammaproteobacteria bacterium]|nr:cbb3-type cytochrome c oxidase subunit 3 [Gammaproteobacteria bacterium]
MDADTLGTLRGLATLFAMLAFIAVCVWAWSGKRRPRFDAAARMPLEEDRS